MDAIYHFYEWPRSNLFSLTLDALVQEGKAKILSQPRISCQSGQTAELMVGGEKPILTTDVTSGGGESTSVSYKDYGITLQVAPKVNQEDKIDLALNVTVSEVEEAVILGSSSNVLALAYPLKKRFASTRLLLNDGQTFAIGGLVKQKTEEEVKKTAGLGDIPILGMLFRRKETRIGGGAGESGNVELFLVLTPKIVRDELPAIEEEPKRKHTPYRSTEGPVDPLLSYGRFIQTRILEKLRYPLLAKDAGFQGTVMLGVHLSAAGELLDVAVKSSSGYKMLDDAAIGAAKALYPYPPFPAGIKKKELWIDVPIEYQLD
jgi:TonB family protein